MAIRLVAIDIDGTLLNDNHQLTEKVQQVIAAVRQQGVKIVLCSGRPFSGMQPILEQLHLTGTNDYVISYNGSMVQNVESREIIFAAELSQQDYLRIYCLALELGVHLHVSSNDSIYTANRDLSPYTIFESSLVKMPVKYRTAEEMLLETPKIIKMMMIDEPDILNHAITQIPATFHTDFTLVKSTDYYLEILNRKAGKGSGLKALAEYLQIRPAEIMAIGDNENDISMLTYAGIGVAMQNAIPAVKKASDFITTQTNDQDGVAEALQQFID